MYQNLVNSTEQYDQQIENATLLTAVAICLKHDDLRATLLQMATDPKIVGEKPFGITKSH